MIEKIYPHSYKLVITDLSGGLKKAFEIYVPALKAHVSGETIEDALKAYMIFFDNEVKWRKKKKIAMPVPDSKPDVIKKVLLRIPMGLYLKISELAKREGKSFNSYVTTVLENYLELY